MNGPKLMVPEQVAYVVKDGHSTEIRFVEKPPFGEHVSSEEDLIKKMIDLGLPAASCVSGCTKIRRR